MRTLIAAILVLMTSPIWAASPTDILALNSRGVVYLEVTDSAGQFVDAGTGFIVSHAGHVATVAHVKPEPGQKLWGVIGQRQGPRFILEAREVDEKSDVALWQLPQSATCRYSITISTSLVEVTNRMLVIGFPGRDGLSAATINITNTSDEEGYYKGDGFLAPGYSGGPVFNEDGRVVALVRGGRTAGGNNQFVPIASAINLMTKRGVRAGINAEMPFDTSCYAFCRSSVHGVESWTKELRWAKDSGEVPGGHNRRDECDKLIAAEIASSPGAQIELLSGEGDSSKGMWEESHKDFAGQMHYKYFCQGTLRIGPVYKRVQSPACGLWQ